MQFHFSLKPTALTFVILGNLFFPNLVLAKPVETQIKTVVHGKSNSIRFPVAIRPDPNYFYNSSVDQILSRMSVDEKVGQLLLVGFPQEKLDAKLSKHINRNKIGSFLVFKRNIVSLNQLKNLNSGLVALSVQQLRIPPLMAIDQEGGNVNRIATNPKLPFLFHFGDLADTKFSYHYGYYTGQLLGSLGFNLNLAPVLDLADFDSNRFIALRSFGSDPNRASQNGFAYSQGLLNQKVIPTAKHFPGLGSAILDPHDTVVSNSASMSQMDQAELAPFKDFAKLGPHSAVMMSHMIYKGIDSSGLPASFSNFIMEELLRKRIGFQGVIVTDDLHMKSSSGSISPSEAALRSLKAGSDLVMLSWSFTEQTRTFDRIKEAIIKKELSMEDINQKVKRILTLKKFVYAKPLEINPILAQAENKFQEARGIASVGPADINNEPSKITIDSSSVHHLLKSVLDAKVKAVFFRPQLEQKKLLCLVSDQKRLFTLIGKRDSKVFKGYHYPKQAAAKSLAQFFKSSACDLFIITVETASQARVLNNVEDFSNKKMVVINHAIPTILQNRARYFSVLDLYGLNIQTEDILADKISEFANMILRGQFRSAYISK